MAETNIQLTPEAQGIIRDLTDTSWLLTAVAAGMDAANKFTMSKIERRLIGTGPFPPSEHRLGFRSGSLRKYLWSSKPVINGGQVTSTIGDNVTNRGFNYAVLHEFGGHVSRKPRSGSVRLRVTAHGELMRNTRGGARFAKAGHKRAKTVAFQAEGYEYDVPARAPMQTGIEESLTNISVEVSKAITRAWEARK